MYLHLRTRSQSFNSLLQAAKERKACLLYTSNAAGHLEGSSLPVGGKSTHSVISAHRGLPSAILFTDLDKMKKGNHFMIYVLDDILCYEVDRISIVKPEDTSDLNVEKGKDMMTLLTCTPYGVNTETVSYKHLDVYKRKRIL